MAKRAKAPASEFKLDPADLQKHDAELSRLQQIASDKNMQYAGYFKMLDKQGYNLNAIKAVRKWKKMDTQKFLSEWKALNSYVDVLLSDALSQTDLFAEESQDSDAENEVDIDSLSHDQIKAHGIQDGQNGVSSVKNPYNSDENKLVWQEGWEIGQSKIAQSMSPQLKAV